jgi:hypothetical protein
LKAKESIILGLICLAVYFNSCSDSNAPRIVLNEQERIIYDSLYTNQLEIVRRKIDSLCVADRDSLMAIAIDSIMEVRLEEAQSLMEEGRE